MKINNVKIECCNNQNVVIETILNVHDEIVFKYYCKNCHKVLLVVKF
jgi:hypothetical protein